MSGPTHGSAPTNSIETSLNPGRSGRGQSPAPTGLSWCAAAGRCGHRPLRKGGEAPSMTLASGAQRSVCGADRRKGWGSQQRSFPKCPATSGNPSVAAKPRQLPLHKGALACGGRGGHRSAIGVPSNPRRGGTEPAPYRKAGNTQRAGAINAQGRSEICRAIVDLVFCKAKCSE